MANYQDLRARTMVAEQEEEAVTVNTRALIDKVLARYSSENTTLRELLQNAADANATSVEVRYETLPDSSPSTVDGENSHLQQLIRSKVQRVLVKNNGQAFREEDWQRLKRIAEGNPDETKIGAFGVGFYSVFADCEEPFVSSGDQTMAFYWKGNSLFTRRAKMDTQDPYTTFLLDYREPAELPDLRRLCKFFATSLTFVKLNSISLYVDDRCLLQLNKKQSPPMPLDIPNSINPATVEKMMRIAAVEESRVQLDAKYMNITHYQPPAKTTTAIALSFFSRVMPQRNAAKDKINLSNLHEHTEATIFIRIATAKVNTKVAPKFAKELERATKKPPPASTTLAILTMSRQELMASEHESEIFENVIPNKTGKVFIGFPTHQTTSFEAHISAHSVIPTVERESIDLNARVVKTWNIEMLRTAGILARIMYTEEMLMLKKRSTGLAPNDLAGLHDDAIHIMKQFTSIPSTPDAQVGLTIADAFWSSNKDRSIEVFSTQGVLPSTRVRLSSDVTFLSGIPIIPQKLVDGAPTFVQHLKEGAYLTELTITDIQDGLASKALNTPQAVQFLEWLITQVKREQVDSFGMERLLQVAVAMAPTSVDGQVVENALPVQLGSIRYYVNISKMSSDLPFPPECVPFALTKSIRPTELSVLCWDELTVVEWLRYVSRSTQQLPIEQNIDQSPQFAQKMLALISKSWEQLSQSERDEIVLILKSRTCIPTKQGMKTPGESYFPTVKLFTDLPVVHGIHSVKDKVLVALGVRKTEVRVILERLMSDPQSGDQGQWSHVNLIKYLTTVKNDIPPEDIKKLRSTAMCKCESGENLLFKVSELYEPTEELRKLKFPLLQWPGVWNPVGSEASFLLALGLQKYPSEPQLLKKAAQRDDDILRESALRYYCTFFQQNNYKAELAYGLNFSYLPLSRECGEKGRLVMPRECYSNPRALTLRFDILREDLCLHASKFGVKANPDMMECVDRLISQPPAGIQEARVQFGYFLERIADIYPQHTRKLTAARIVPIKTKTGIKHLCPKDCYVGSADNIYRDIFDFVDFGSAINAFLMKCGSKTEPTVVEIAYQVAREPARLYGVFQSEEKYLRTLRHIAENFSTLRKDKQLVTELKNSPCLGAHVEIPVKRGPLNGTSDILDDDDSGSIKQFELARADQIVLIGYDYASYMIFRGKVMTAPQEDALETFYALLGSVQLVTKVETKAFIGSVINDMEATQKLRNLIIERTRLFLHQQERNAIRRDARYLEKSLDVQFVKTIRQRKTLLLDGSSRPTHEEEKTATLSFQKSGTAEHTLYVTRNHQPYDIATQITKLCLHKPELNSSLLLESLLSTDLYTLKARGFNVDRILRAKQAEARLMEQERLKQVEAQQKALEEQERRYQEEQKRLEQQRLLKKESESFNMPGGFIETPDRHKPEPPPEGLLSRGFNRFSTFFNETNQRKRGESHVPPQLTNGTNESGPQAQPQPPKPSPENGKPAPETATEPHRLKANLVRAIQAGQNYDANSLFSRPETFEVKEEKFFCDSRPGQNIVFAADTQTGIKLYFSKELSDADKSGFMRDNARAIAGFSELLKNLAEVYSMDPRCLHMFYDAQGKSIAFNSNGSIFCNMRYYLQLHQRPEARLGYDGQAVAYWFVILAHELAHNIKSDHGSQHSFWTESFIQEYFALAMAKYNACSVEEDRPPPYADPA